MTENEFKTQLLPVLSGLWPKMVTRTTKNATEFDVAAARERNRNIFDIIGRFEVQSAIQASRAQAREHPDFPAGKGYGWVLDQIRVRLTGEQRQQVDPAAWTWRDECTLWHCLAFYAPSVRLGTRGPEWLDELHVARHKLGKCPSSSERDEAYAVLCNHIDDQRDRCVVLGATVEEAQAKYPYPRVVLRELQEQTQ